ncbi:MAG: molybdenum cofactor guanylyltransferase [Gemmatimonadota bacterium]
MNKSSSVGSILAGGRSSRLGSPKGLASVGGQPLVSRLIGVLRQVLSRIVVVTNDPNLYRTLRVEIVGDEHPGRGPLSGVEAALKWARDIGANGVVCLPCDAAFVDPELIRRLMVRSAGRTAVLPRSAGPLGYEPLFAWYPVSALDVATRCLADERPAMHSFVESLPRVSYLSIEEVREIADPEILFFNVNTGDDLERAERIDAERNTGAA